MNGSKTWNCRRTRPFRDQSFADVGAPTYMDIIMRGGNEKEKDFTRCNAQNAWYYRYQTHNFSVPPTTKCFFTPKLRRLAKIYTIPTFARPGNQRFPVLPAPWWPNTTLWCLLYRPHTNTIRSFSMVERFISNMPTTPAKRTDCNGPQLIKWWTIAHSQLVHHHSWQWSIPGSK